MRTSIILLLTLLMVTACAPLQPKTPTSEPVPVGLPSETPAVSGNAYGTVLPPCVCPTGVVPPTQPPVGYASPDHIVCNCPIMLATPPDPTSGVGSVQSGVSANGISLADNGKTFSLHPGESFLLNLGMDVYDWTVSIDNQNVLSRERNVMPIQGAQGVYLAGDSGAAVLSAVGDPLCRNAKPACMAPSILFTVTIIVQ